jgi:hypothetical protein
MVRKANLALSEEKNSQIILSDIRHWGSIGGHISPPLPQSEEHLGTVRDQYITLRLFESAVLGLGAPPR